MSAKNIRAIEKDELKDATTCNQVARAYALLVSASQRMHKDQRLAKAVKLVWQVHDELTPDPQVMNPAGIKGKRI
jgi:hypothetical protein